MFPEERERPLDLANVVPGTRSLVGEPRGDFGPYYDALDGAAAGLPHNLAHLLSPHPAAQPLDDEHRLVARYAAKLGQGGRESGRGGTAGLGGATFHQDDPYAQRSAISRLQQRNRHPPSNSPLVCPRCHGRWT